MGLVDTDSAYRDYRQSLDVLSRIDESLAVAIERASEEHVSRLRKIDEAEPDYQQSLAQAEQLAEATLSRGTEALRTVGIQGMLPKKRRPSPTDKVSGQDLPEVRARMASLLGDLEAAVESIRERRRREEDEVQRLLEAERLAKLAKDEAARKAGLLREERRRRIRNVAILIALVALVTLVIVLSTV